MKIYLAARFSRNDEMRGVRDVLHALGHKVTSRWIDLHGGDQQESAAQAVLNSDPSSVSHFGQHDLEDITAADTLICFTSGPARVDIGRSIPPGDEVERWAPVASTLGYEVSNFGRVRNGAGDMIYGKKDRGYLRVMPNGVHASSAYIHGLVAEAFIGPRPPDHEVDHGDGHKDNNWIGNLEYVTHLENIRRAEARQARGSRAGTSNGRAKLTDYDVIEIRDRARGGVSKAAIARDYGVSDVLVGKIVRGALWTEVDAGKGGYHVEFGYGLALGKRAIVVGPREHIFHTLPEVEHFDNWGRLVMALTPAFLSGASA